MTEPASVILASGSAIRAQILRNAGVAFEIIKPGVDEDLMKTAAKEEGLGLEEMAMRLAEEKCMAVAAEHNGLVIGSDQILEFEGEAFDKPENIEAARARLLAMQGKKHTLINATAVAKNGEIIWRHLERPALYLRPASEAEIDAYLAEAGPEILHSVAAYLLEKTGSRLFARIEGDYFAILGLALFPLLDLLRAEGVLEY